MDGAYLDALQGKHYVFPVLDNDVVKVQSAGRSIRIGIKDDRSTESCWLEPAYPFTPQPFELPRQAGWKVTVGTDGPAVQTVVFEKKGRRHVLILTVTDVSAKPMPVTVSWT
jgi:hypothetical protein